jgi:C4-dicarboxylate transporter, DctQ subunit
MRLLRHLGIAFDAVVDGLAVLAGILLVLGMLSVSLDVVMRYFFTRPLFWVDELAEYSLLWITFCGTTWLLKQDDGHVVVDILGSRINPRKRSILTAFACIVGGFVSIILTYYSVKTTYGLFARGIYNPTLLEIPKGAVAVIIPVGSFMLCVQFIRNFFRHLASLRGR